jgi:hypothetical protein
VAGGRSCRAPRQLRRDGNTGRRQGLTILAREVNKIAARIVPNSQAEWLWDCTTPETALTGTSVSAGALRFPPHRLNRGRDEDSGFSRSTNIFLHAARGISSSALAALKGPGFQPCLQEARKIWLLGPEGQPPRRLKPGPLVGVNGTPEGVPLQSRQTDTEIVLTEIASCATAGLSVPHTHVRAA